MLRAAGLDVCDIAMARSAERSVSSPETVFNDVMLRSQVRS